jgi:hypothetical protein
VPACYESLDFDKCNTLLALVAGLRVSRVWQSIEPTVIVQLGRLRRERLLRRTRLVGQVHLMIESDWRIEKSRCIHFGSSFSESARKRLLPGLIGLRATALSVEPRTRELCMEFSDGRALRTFTDWAQQPRWTVLFYDHSRLPMEPVWRGVDVTPCIHVQRGRPQIEYAFDKSGADVAALKRRYRCPRGSI